MKTIRLTAALLLSALFLGLAGCAERPPAAAAEKPAATSDLTAGIVPSSAAAGGGSSAGETGSDPAAVSAVADFAVNLFRQSAAEGENVLVSPLSVWSALSMTANGARGDTLDEMDAVLGTSADGRNAFFRLMRERLAGDGGETRFHLANSIWFADDGRLAVNPDFLQTNVDFYGAGVYARPFDDAAAEEINGWVKENTDGMIPSILDRIPENAVMYLVNALAFDGAWMEPYDDFQVYPGDFTRGDGTKTRANFMHSEENVYLEDGDAAVGFVKYYRGGKFAFAALLPREGTKVSDYVNALDGERLSRILSSAENTPVEAALPKFKAEYGAELSDALKTMGMPTVFDENEADLSGIGEAAGNLYISRVLHKTFLSVDERGTKAGAATAVEVAEKGMMMPREPKRVTLDRPFVYMLIDCETNLPLFLGILADPAA